MRTMALLALLALPGCVGPTTVPYYLVPWPEIHVSKPTPGAVFRPGQPIHIHWVAHGRADTRFKATVLRRVDGGRWGDKVEEGVLLHGTSLAGNGVTWENWELAYLGTIPDGRYVLRVESNTLRPGLLRAWGESGEFELRR